MNLFIFDVSGPWGIKCQGPLVLISTVGVLKPLEETLLFIPHLKTWTKNTFNWIASPERAFVVYTFSFYNEVEWY